MSEITLFDRGSSTLRPGRTVISQVTTSVAKSSIRPIPAIKYSAAIRVGTFQLNIPEQKGEEVHVLHVVAEITFNVIVRERILKLTAPPCLFIQKMVSESRWV